MSSMISGGGGGTRGRRLFQSTLSSANNLETMDAAELFKLNEQLKVDLEYTQLENGMIERYLDKNDPELLLGVTQLMLKPRQPTRIHFAESSITMNVNTEAIVTSQRSKRADNMDTMSMVTQSNVSQSFRSNNSLGLNNSRVNYTMRSELCDQDTLRFSLTLDRIRSSTREELRLIVAKVEELKITKEEAIETLNEFRTFVLASQEQGHAMKVPLERYLKFIDKWMRNGAALVEKMRLRNDHLKQQINQMQKALAIKAELSGILRPIDFEQLEVDKHDFLETIEKQVDHFVGLKKANGDVALTLSTHRKHLEKSQFLYDVILTKITRMGKETGRLDRLAQQLDGDIQDWRNRIESIQQRFSQTVMPSTDEYMEKKKMLRSLDTQVGMLRRLRSIEATQLAIVRRKIRTVKKHKRLEIEQQKLDKKNFDKIAKATRI